MSGLVFLLVLGMGAPSAQAEEARGMRVYGIGPRLGLSVNPDQFVFGGQVDFGDPFPQTNVLLPVVEIGLGDDQSVVSLGGDVLFRFRDRWGEWNPYLGGELGLLFTSVDLPGGDEESETNLGLSGVFGLEKGMGESGRFAFDLKFKIVDAPDVKFITSWTFGH
jgi:hypothetical protein